MKTLVIYNKINNSIWGYVKLGTDSDAKLYPPDPENQVALEIPNDHPAPNDQGNWYIQGGNLVKGTNQ